MRYYAGLDVSQHTTNVCVMNETGAVVREAKVETNPDVLADYLQGQGLRYHRIGLESANMAHWLYTGLIRKRLSVICIEARHASRVLKANLNKTDRNDARGIAELMRVGIYRAVHMKSPQARADAALLTARRLLLNKAIDLELCISGILRGVGVKMGRIHVAKYDAQVRAIVRSHKTIRATIEHLLKARTALRREFDNLDHEVTKRATADPVCQRFLTAPGIGPITALTYRCVIDDPHRFGRSRTVGAHLGLTSRTRQSGESEWRTRISRFGDRSLRAALFIGAMNLFRARTRPSDLKAWGQRIAERRGKMKAIVAVARQLAVILHRMWIDGADFRRHAPAA